MNEGNSLGSKGTIGLQAAVPKKPHTRPLTLMIQLTQSKNLTLKSETMILCNIVYYSSIAEDLDLANGASFQNYYFGRSP